MGMAISFTPRRVLDPTRPLYVAQQLPAAHDPVTGAQRVLRIGERFDPASVDRARLATLFRARYLTHDAPKAPPPTEIAIDASSFDALSAAITSPPAPTESLVSALAKPKRARAGA